MTERIGMMNVEAIVAALREETGEVDLPPQESRLYLGVLNQLSQGRAVTADDVAAIASKEGLSQEQADEILLWLAEKNKEGLIIGLGGLSLNQHWSHGFKVNGNHLKTWCALDTLYLPPVLKRTAEVESRDPVTGVPIRLTIGPDRLESYSPEGAVLSLVVPSIKEKGIQSAEQVWTALCHYSHYFESEANAVEWFEGKGQEPLFLSLEDGYRLGRLWFEKLARYA